MADKPDSNEPRKTSKWGWNGAYGGFLTGIGAAVTAAAVVVGAGRLFSKEYRSVPFHEVFGRLWSDWFNKAICGFTTAVFTVLGYFRAVDNNKLIDENKAMRAQLNQTGQTLNQVTEKIEQAKFAAQEKPPTSHAEQVKIAAVQTATPAIN